MNKVLITDSSGNVTWGLQSALPFVSSVGTSNGLAVGGVAGGTITSTGTIGLYGWEIVLNSDDYVLRPQGTNVGNIGDSTHVINQIYDTTLTIVGSNSNAVNITASATTSNYNITLPPQINSSFGNNAVMSITNTGIATFNTKLQQDNVTLPFNFITETPATSPFNATTLNSVYAFDFTTFGSSGNFSVVIPDATGSNAGFSLCIYKSSSDNVNLIITTVSNQQINAATSYTLIAQGQAVLLVAQNASNWVIMGTSIPSFYVPLPLAQYFTAEYYPVAQSAIYGPGSQIIAYTNVLNNNLPGVTYNTGTGVFTFTIGGTYTIFVDQTIGWTLDSAANTYIKLSFINGTTTSGTEITNGPCLFPNYQTNALTNNVSAGSNTYMPGTYNIESYGHNSWRTIIYLCSNGGN